MIDQVRCFKKWKKLHLYYLCFTLRDISRYGLDRDMTGKLFKAKANKKNELLRKLETT
jgi:hypothetical protein